MPNTTASESEAGQYRRRACMHGGAPVLQDDGPDTIAKTPTSPQLWRHRVRHAPTPAFPSSNRWQVVQPKRRPRMGQQTPVPHGGACGCGSVPQLRPPRQHGTEGKSWAD